MRRRNLDASSRLARVNPASPHLASCITHPASFSSVFLASPVQLRAVRFAPVQLRLCFSLDFAIAVRARARQWARVGWARRVGRAGFCRRFGRRAGRQTYLLRAATQCGRGVEMGAPSAFGIPVGPYRSGVDAGDDGRSCSRGMGAAVVRVGGAHRVGALESARAFRLSSRGQRAVGIDAGRAGGLGKRVVLI